MQFKTKPFLHYPDIVTYLQNETEPTRQSIVSILINSQRPEAFKKNPQAFIESVISKKIMSNNSFGFSK